MVKYGICYISAKNGRIATKRKPNISIELLGSNVTIGFDRGHDLDLEFSRSKIEFAISRPKMVRLPRNKKQTYRLNSMCMDLPDSDRGDFSCRRAVDSSSLVGKLVTNQRLATNF